VENYETARVVAAVIAAGPRAYAEDVPKLHAVHHRPKVIIAGTGVAGLEALLALRALLGGTIEIQLLAAEPEFVYQPIAVAEPFGLGEVRQLELARIASEHGAHLRHATLASVDPSVSVLRTDRGEELSYDYLLVAVGARQWSALDGAITFGGSEDRDALVDLMGMVKAGAARRVMFAAPAEVAWLLPLYELALFTASWARQREIDGLALTLVTYEERPLEAFGSTASATVSRLLDDASVRQLTGRTARRFDGTHLFLQGGRKLVADAVVALPALAGPAIPGLPHDEHGFIPTDRHGAVRGVSGVYAAGDGAAFPIKQGGLAAQQADAVASSIAAALGAIDHAQPFTPVLRGMLLTGAEPRYLRASPNGEHGSEVSFAPLWWPPGKIAGRYLAPYLAHPDDPQLTRSELVVRPAPGETEEAEDARAEEREAVELLLEMADANAKRGSFDFAVMCLDAAEDVGGPLPAARQADRHTWSRQRSR
jgi:sulfide:quinone oxidoreductase